MDQRPQTGYESGSPPGPTSQETRRSGRGQPWPVLPHSSILRNLLLFFNPPPSALPRMFGFVKTLNSHHTKSPNQTKVMGGLQQGLKVEGMNRKQRCGHVSSALRPDPAPGRLAPSWDADSEANRRNGKGTGGAFKLTLLSLTQDKITAFYIKTITKI